MKFGLVGYGKMGSEIFSVLFDSLEDTTFTIVSIGDLQECREKVEKQLAKQLKRKKLTEETYAKKLESFVFTEDYQLLSDCDAVLECIFEDIDAKQELMEKLSGIVSEKCLLLSNTSSLHLEDVFAKATHKERCLGMHFFYPVKLSGFAELNYLPENTDEVLNTAEKILTDAGKRALRFAGTYHIYLNQILALTISQAIWMHETYGCSISQFDKAVSGLFPISAPFEILDTVSLGLMAKNPDGFRIPRNQALLNYGYIKMNEWLSDGCPSQTGTFYDYMAAKENDSACDTSAFCDELIALVLNESVSACLESGCEKNVLLDAVQDVLGLAEPLGVYYQKLQYERIAEILSDLYVKTGFAVYKAADKEKFDNVYR